MRLRNVKNAKEINEGSKYFLPYKDALESKGAFALKVFGNMNPIHVEVGMGKGQFLIKMAINHPEINFVGIEMAESVLCRAIQKLDKLDLPNVRVINGLAECLNDIFDYEIETIYLNFSDPWPKKRHAKRRLTSDIYLSIYDTLFVKDRLIIQKTDNIGLFASSIVNLTTNGYVIEECSLDLANSDIINYTTEYEDKFMDLKVKINYLKARKK